MKTEHLKNKKEWFSDWFNSPYYHILYKHRDFEEARAFMDKLITYLNFQKDHEIMDLACGKGRHAIYLNQKGLKVTGLDLSPKNIAYAKKFENERLSFYEHDMREVFAKQGFDFVLNLFTSFGYFDTKEEHQQAINSITQSLKPGGKFLLDFLNPYKIIHSLVPCEKKEIEGIQFEIRKFIEGDYIVKEIRFSIDGHPHAFLERVKAIRRTEFLSYFENAGLQLVEVFGDYELNEYEAENSDRLIFLLEND